MRRRGTRAVLALATTGLLAVLAACGGSDAADGPVDLADKKAGSMADFAASTQFTATQPLTISMLFSDNASYPDKADWAFWSELTRRTNVTLAPTVVPQSDYLQKRSLLIGAGDAPTIIAKTYPNQELDYVASGAILPVSDYLDLMPNLQDKIKKWNLDPELATLRQADGKFYLLPGIHEQVWQDYTLAFRTDELARLGLATPKTWDDVYTVLKAIKQAHPDSYPLTDRYKGDPLLSIIAQGFGTSAGFDGWGYQDALLDDKTGKFIYTGATPQYKQMVEYLHKLVAEGLLDPESFTQDDDSAIGKFASGKAYAISTNSQQVVNDYRPGIKGIPGATVAKIPFPAGPAGNVLRTNRLENGLMLSAKATQSPNFVATMQFIDWLWYSDEGQEFAKWGVPGMTYDKDASGTRVLKSDITYNGINPGAPKHLQKNYGFSGGNFAYGGSTNLLESMFTPEEKAFQETAKAKTVLPQQPPHPLTADERETATLYRTPLEDLTRTATLQFVLGQRDLSTWDAYVQELQTKGMDKYLDLVNGAYQRYPQKAGG